MALIEFDGELDPPASPAAPRLKEFSGELDPPAPAPQLKEFSGVLDPAPPAPTGGFLRSFVDIAKSVGEGITSQTGRRQRLEQQAGGVSALEPRPSDFELQERIAQRAGQPAPPPSMTQGPANPKTYVPNAPLNTDSRPGEVIRSAIDIASRVPEQAINAAGQALVGAKRWLNDASNRVHGITADPLMDGIYDQQTADLKKRETAMHAPLTPAQSFTTRAAGEGLKQAATAIAMAPLAAAAGAGKAGEVVRLGAGMAVPAAAQKYEDLSAAGLKGAPLAIFSALSGAIEGGTEAIPFTFMKYAQLPGFREAVGAYKAGNPSLLADFAKYYAGSMATETAQEIPATVLGHQLDFVTGDPTATAKRLGSDLADTVAALPIQGAVQAGVMHGARRLHANTLGRQSPQDRVAEELARTVDATQFSRPAPAEIAEASVLRAPEPAPSAKGMPMQPMQQSGMPIKPVLREHAGELRGRTLAETLARIPEETRAVSPDPTRTVTGQDFASIPPDAPGDGFYLYRNKGPEAANVALHNAMEESVREAGLPPELAAKIKVPSAETYNAALALPAEVRYWYERSAEGFARNYFSLPGSETERLIDVVAASSGNKQPYDNVKDAIAALASDLQGTPVAVGFRDPTSVGKALSPEEIDTHKFGNFAGTMQMVARTREGKPLPTIDLQMAKMYGVKQEDVASDPRMYEAIARHVMKVRDMQNAFIQKGAQPYESWQIQALGWVNQRGTTDPDDYASAMPRIIKILNDAGIPTPGGKITEETLRDPRTPTVLAPSSKMAQGTTMTFETRTTQTPVGASSTETAGRLGERPESWARKAEAKYERIQRATMEALGNKRPHPAGLPTKAPSLVSNLFSAIAGKTAASWDVSRIDTGGYGTFMGVASPNMRIPGFLSPRGKSASDRITLDEGQMKVAMAVLGRAFKQEAMAASSFADAPLGKHDTFTVFIPQYGKEDAPTELLAAIESAIGWPVNYSRAPNGWVIDINKFDSEAPALNERDTINAISPVLGGLHFRLLPRSYGSVYIEAGEYDQIIKEFEDGLSRDPYAGRGAKARNTGSRYGDFIATVEGIAKVAAEQEAAFGGWDQETRARLDKPRKGLPKAPLQQSMDIRGESYDIDAPNFGFPPSPITLPDNDPLLRSTDKLPNNHVRPNGQTTEQLRVSIINRHFAGKKPVKGRKPRLILMAGGGGSGKGYVKKALEKQALLPHGAIDLDPDEIKTSMIPEFRHVAEAGDSRAAAVTHEESSALSKAIFARAVDGGYDIIFDRTMAEYDSAMKLLKAAQAAGYDIDMQVVLTDARIAAVQAMGRASKTGRYVPPDAFLRAHKGIAAYLERYIESGFLSSAVVWDNRGNPIPIAEFDGSEYNIFDDEAYRDIVDRAVSIDESATTLRGVYGKESQSGDEALEERRAAGFPGGVQADRAGSRGQGRGGLSGGDGAGPEGKGAAEVRQAGGAFVYGPMQVSDAGLGLAAQYSPKISERDMDKRGLQPLERKQKAEIDAALGDLVAAGLPKAWTLRPTYYGLKPIGIGLANYNPEDGAIGVLFPTIDAAARGEEESRKFVRGWLAHELHHSIDNYRNSSTEMFYMSAESPRMDLRVLPNGKFVGAGDLTMEAMNVWNGVTEASDELVQYLGYPMLQAQSMAGRGDAETAMTFAKVELFAQLGAMYSTNPQLMERELPQWFAFFKEWNDARGDGSIERSRVTLRGLFQKSVPKYADPGRGRGAGLAARPVGQDQQRPVLTTGGSGVGTNAPGAGNGRGPAVLPAAPKAAPGQNALGAYRSLSRSKIPGDDHIPTHVNYSTFNSANELKKVYAGLSEKFEKEIQAQRRGTISINESYRDARKLFEDESGISARKVSTLLERKPGTPAGAAEILARMAILESETAKVEAMAKKIEQQGALQTSEQEWLDFAAQLDRAAMAHQTFLGARAEIGRALNAIKGFAGMPYDGKQVQSVLDTYKGPEGLGKVATAIAQSGRNGGGAGRSNAIGRLAKAAAKATITDAVIELWKANLLSGPTTHLANIVSNALFTVMRLPEQAVAGTVGALHGGKSAHLGQTLALAFGMSHGVVQGFRAAGRIMADEDATFGATPTEEHQHAISGDTFGAGGRLGAAIDYLGKAVRLPFRMLSAEDAVFKMINMYGSLYSAAMRQALDEGGRYWDKGFSNRVAELIKEGEQVMLDPVGAMGPTSVSEAGKAVGQEAIADGLTYTFQNKLGKIGQSVEMVRNNVKATHFIIPFVRTPLNIFRQGLERTPFAPMSKQWRDEVAAGGHARDMALGKAMLGTSLMAAVWAAVEAGLITGGGDPEDYRRKRRMEAGIIPYGIKINGKWYEYRRLEPLGTIIGAAADAAETRRYAQEDNAEHVMAMAAAAFSQAVTSKTYMKGLSDLVNVMAQPERYGERWYQSMAGSIVPGAVGQYAARNDLEDGRPVVRDVRSMGEGVSGLDDLKQTTANAIKNRLPKTPLNPEFNREALPKRIDTWGDTQTSPPGTFSGSPIRMSEPTGDPVRQEAQRLGIKMTDVGTKVMGVKMNASQLEGFSRASGRLAHDVLSILVTHESWQRIPDFAKVKVFEEAIKAGREYGRGIITPEVIDKAIDKTLKGLADVESD